MSLVELARFGSRIEADLARLMLDNEGIETIIFDDQANSFYGGFGLIPVRLMVLDQEHDDAQALLVADAKEGGLRAPD